MYGEGEGQAQVADIVLEDPVRGVGGGAWLETRQSCPKVVLLHETTSSGGRLRVVTGGVRKKAAALR
jgi:hypothetical protein